jgi:phosphoglycolate phosphatase
VCFVLFVVILPLMSLVVFDLDGTLVDSQLDLANSTNEMLEGYGASALPVARVAGFVGEGARVLVERAMAAAGVRATIDEALDRFREIYGRRLLEHTRPYDGLAAVVRDAAARVPLAVLTNKPEAPTRRLLEAFDLAAAFSWVIGGDSGFPRKPDPASLRHIAQAAGVEAAAVLFVGDSMVDVETARRAGVRMCVARYGFGHLRGELVLADDEIVAETPADVGPIIERFLGR